MHCVTQFKCSQQICNKQHLARFLSSTKGMKHETIDIFVQIHFIFLIEQGEVDDELSQNHYEKGQSIGQLSCL